MPISTYFGSRIIGHMFGGILYVSPRNIYAGLLTDIGSMPIIITSSIKIGNIPFKDLVQSS